MWPALYSQCNIKHSGERRKDYLCYSFIQCLIILIDVLDTVLVYRGFVHFNTFMCPKYLPEVHCFFLHQMTLFHPLDFVGAVVLRALSTQIKSSAVAQLKKLCVCLKPI